MRPTNAWPPGVSQNPGGRPKGCSILNPWLRKLAENLNEQGEGERASGLAEILLTCLESGDIHRAKVILQALQVTDPQVKEIAVTHMENDGAVPLEDEDEIEDEPE